MESWWLDVLGSTLAVLGKRSKGELANLTLIRSRSSKLITTTHARHRRDAGNVLSARYTLFFVWTQFLLIDFLS